MRLTKTIYAIEEVNEIIGWDDFMRPIYGDEETIYHPIPCEIEPYSGGLAQHRYGVFADITHRAFTRPNDLLKLTALVRYDGEDIYKIIEIMKYDKHYELLIKKELN